MARWSFVETCCEVLVAAQNPMANAENIVMYIMARIALKPPRKLDL